MPEPVASDAWRKFVNPAPKFSVFGHVEPLQAWTLDQVQGFGPFFLDGTARPLGSVRRPYTLLPPKNLIPDEGGG